MDPTNLSQPTNDPQDINANPPQINSTYSSNNLGSAALSDMHEAPTGLTGGSVSNLDSTVAVAPSIHAPDPVSVGNDVVAPPASATTTDTSSGMAASSESSQEPSLAAEPEQPTMVAKPVIGKESHSKKKWLVPTVIVLLVLLLAAGYALIVYLPNRPQTVFYKSLANTGTAADSLIHYATHRTNSQAATIDGTMTINSGSTSIDGTISGASSAAGSQATVKLMDSGNAVVVNERSLPVSGSTTPDIYLQLNGLKTILGDNPFTAQFATLDGQWIAIDHTFIDSYQKQLISGMAAAVTNAPTAAQINDAVAKVQAVNKQYLFTNDPTKSVLVYKSFVGKTTLNGEALNHYTATYNSDHLKAYINAVGRAIDDSSLAIWMKAQNDGETASEIFSSLNTKVSSSSGSEVMQVYADKTRQLIESIVIPLDAGSNTLTIAQNYTGGSTYPLSIEEKSASGTAAKTDMKLGLTINTSTNVAKVVLGGASSGSALKASITITPSNKVVTIVRPTSTEPITTVLDRLGVNLSSLDASTSTSTSNL